MANAPEPTTYVRSDELRRRINDFLQGAFGLPESDYYGRLNARDLLRLKSALSDINNAVTMRLTLGFLEWVSRTRPIDAAASAEVRASVLGQKPSSNGYDIVCAGPVPFVAEVKCNIPVNGGKRYGAAQRSGILKDIAALSQGKRKALPVGTDALRFMVFMDLPEVRAANDHLASTACAALGALRFLASTEVPTDTSVVYGAYADLAD